MYYFYAFLLFCSGSLPACLQCLEKSRAATEARFLIESLSRVFVYLFKPVVFKPVFTAYLIPQIRNWSKNLQSKLYISLKNHEYILPIGGEYSIYPCVAATQIFMSQTKISNIHAKNYIPRNFIQKTIYLLIFLEKLLLEVN